MLPSADTFKLFIVCGPEMGKSYLQKYIIGYIKHCYRTTYLHTNIGYAFHAKK